MNKFVVTELIGGLGNQLFQYALGKSVAESKGTDLYLDVSGFKNYPLRKYELHKYRISESFANEAMSNELLNLKRASSGSGLRRLLGKATTFYGKSRIHFEKNDFVFEPEVFSMSNEQIYFSGFWQSYRYLQPIEKKLREEFTLKKDATGKNLEFLNLATQEAIVAVHIRRGDYVSNPNAAQFHGTCGVDYYLKAALKVESILGKCSFAVFSDDIEWCRQNIRFNSQMIFIDYNSSDQGEEDIRLMQHCSGHIIANSSFSWWGAWLAGDRSKIVIAPSNWTKKHPDVPDLIPAHWLKI